MGYVGNLEAKLKAQTLRRKGFSYSEIQKIILVPKSTLSGWCRDIALTEKQALRLFKNKLKGSARGRIIGAKRQQAKRLNQIKELHFEGKKQVGRLNKRDRFIAGIALYAGEGTKATGPAFANTDPVAIKFMMNWFREFCKTPENKFRGAIWIHEGLNEQKAKIFWSDLTSIPIDQFNKTYVAENKKDSRKVRKNKHQYGVFSIKFYDLKVLRLINGWIGGVLDKSLV